MLTRAVCRTSISVVAGLAVYFAAHAAAFACSPSRGSLSELLPDADSPISQQAKFTAVWTGAAPADDDGSRLDIALTGPDGDSLSFEQRTIAQTGLVGGYVLVEPSQPLPSGEVAIDVAINTSGDAPNRQTEITRTYTVDPEEASGSAPAPSRPTGSTVHFELPPNTCVGRTFARAQFGLPTDAPAPAYTIVQFSTSDGGQTQSFAVSGDAFADDGVSVDFTTDLGFKPDCVEAYTASAEGARSERSSSCEVLDCGSDRESEGSLGDEVDWNRLCPDSGSDDVGTQDVGTDRSADGGLDWQPSGGDSGCSGCALGGTNPLPTSAAALLAALVGVRLHRRRNTPSRRE